MPRERILIAVKAYPTLSRTYTELVCTAGFREDGSWIRIYPLPFRSLDDERRFRKYQWIEIDLEKNEKDKRPESYRPRDINMDDMELRETIGTDRAWEERRRLVLEKNTVHTNLNKIIKAAKNNEYSLAIFKPTEIVDFIAEPTEVDWEIDREKAAKAAMQQGVLFDDLKLYSKDFKLMPKLPWKFKYKFLDDEGKSSTMMVEDWEAGQLYWSCRQRNTSEEASKKVREKYFDDFARTKDLHFFLGTTFRWHSTAPNPYVVIGTFHPPYVKQLSFFQNQ